MVMRIAFAALVLALAGMPAFAQSARVVALVVSVGDGATRADAIQTQLQLMGAETLRADAPNNAQLRSIVMRFSREAADSRATFVYIDAPAVNFEGRTFVMPEGAILKTATDIFTQAIPIHAFARSSAQAEQGGAVVMTVNGAPGELPAGVTVADHAPEAVPGSSAIVAATVDAFAPLLAIVETAATQDEVEIGTMLKKMSGLAGITVSDIPRIPILLRIAAPTSNLEGPDAATASAVSAIALPEASDTPTTSQTAAGEPREPQNTLEELALLEQSISRAAKRSIQRKLRDLGLYQGLVDGIFGQQTREAIKAFQTSRSEQPTGFLDRRQQLELTS